MFAAYSRINLRQIRRCENYKTPFFVARRFIGKCVFKLQILVKLKIMANYSVDLLSPQLF